MLTIQYFASIRESLNKSGEEIQLPSQVKTVDDLLKFLIASSPEQMAALNEEAKVLVAVNQTIVNRQHPLQGDEEVAFFPPMTGG